MILDIGKKAVNIPFHFSDVVLDHLRRWLIQCGGDFLVGWSISSLIVEIWFIGTVRFSYTQ